MFIPNLSLAILVISILSTRTLAFSPSSTVPRAFYRSEQIVTNDRLLTPRNMFGGAGRPLALEEDDDDEDTGKDSKGAGDSEQRKQMEQMAKAMGMTVDEYMLGMNARMRMEQEINNLRVTGGDESKGVTIERDGNSPPKYLKVNITEDGKAKLGKAGVEKEVVAALKSAGEKSKKGREQAQQRMMQFIAEQMKTMGSK